MAESSFDRELEQLLGYSEPPGTEAFVMDLMQKTRREQRVRKWILWTFGLVGGLFGLAGAVMLSDNISELFTFTLSLPAMETMQAVLFIVAAAAFYIWFMNDDLTVD